MPPRCTSSGFPTREEMVSQRRKKAEFLEAKGISVPFLDGH